MMRIPLIRSYTYSKYESWSREKMRNIRISDGNNNDESHKIEHSVIAHGYDNDIFNELENNKRIKLLGDGYTESEIDVIIQNDNNNKEYECLKIDNRANIQKN